jgi:hypothetical protein
MKAHSIVCDICVSEEKARYRIGRGKVRMKTEEGKWDSWIDVCGAHLADIRKTKKAGRFERGIQIKERTDEEIWKLK